MRNLKYIVFIAGLFWVNPILSQRTGEWLSAEVEVELPKKFSVETSLEARALNPGGIQFYQFFSEAGLNYKINKRFDASLKYRFVWRLEENLQYYYRNKLMVDLKFDYPFGRFKFDYRARFQRINKTYINSEFDRIPTMHVRNRFQFTYDVPKNPVEPSLFFETFFPLNGYNPGPVDQLRMGGRIRYPLKNNQSITGRIMYIHEQFESRMSVIIFTLGYKITLN